MGTVVKTNYGRLSNGRAVHQYILKNKAGCEIRCIEYGATITHWYTPDRAGNLNDIVLGYDQLDDYIQADSYLGAVVGRYGNRIEKGSFSLNGQRFNIPQNESPNNLHSGPNGFDKKLWIGKASSNPTHSKVTFSLISPDGENGFPGELKVQVTYFLHEDNSLEISYQATTSKPTVVNLTQHTYFNLEGRASKILDHKLMINSDKIVAVDEASIPLSDLMKVEQTPFDFRTPARIGDRITEEHPQLRLGKGFDHTFVLNSIEKPLITVYDPFSGRTMEVLTSEPGVQFYTGNHLNNSIPGKNGTAYHPHFGFCLETQHYPNSPNRNDFPSTQLDPGKTYVSSTTYKMGAR